jgi:hypothetical protein
MLIPYTPTCSRRSAALATYAENRDCPGNSLSAGDEGRSLPNSRARKLTEPFQPPEQRYEEDNVFGTPTGNRIDVNKGDPRRPASRRRVACSADQSPSD